jgi:hypothetical protein
VPDLAFLLTAVNQEELKKLFWIDVRDVAAGFQLKIEPDCEERLDGFIEHGTERIANEQLLNSPRRIGQAETNLIGFVGGMAFQARMENLYSLTVWTFDSAKKVFCPLWPFC